MDSNKHIPYRISSLMNSPGSSRETNNGNIPQSSDIQTGHFSTDNNYNDASNNVMNNHDNYPTHYPTPKSISPEPNRQQYDNDISVMRNHDNPTSIPPDPDNQQCDPSNNNNTTIFPSQSTSNGISDNDDTNAQFYSRYIGQNPPQSSIFPLLNSLRINVNSPQTNIIIMPATNSDINNQLQQVYTYLNHSNNSPK